MAKKGFGSKGAAVKSSSKARKKGPGLPEDVAETLPINRDWTRLASAADFKEGQTNKLVEVQKGGLALVLYKLPDGRAFCSEATSTAYKFPLIDAKVVEREGGPAVEVPLDGTVYDLATGAVLEWCPRNNLLRSLLGALKSKQTPTPLPVYQAQMDAKGNIFVDLRSIT